MSVVQSDDSYVTGKVMNIQYNVTNIGAGEPYENYWQDVIVSTYNNNYKQGWLYLNHAHDIAPLHCGACILTTSCWSTWSNQSAAQLLVRSLSLVLGMLVQEARITIYYLRDGDSDSTLL